MTYDIAIIGSGPGGYVAAIKAAQMGAKVAIIEKNYFGGVCLNFGCIPTKTLLKSAKVYKYIKNASKFGIDLDESSVNINWNNMISRKDKVVEQLTSGVKYLLKKNNVTIFRGMGSVIDKNSLSVNGETINYKNLIIATGSTPRIPDIPGVKEGLSSGFVLTSKEILSLDSLPKELTILGGGVIGIEFAMLYSSIGTKVTIIQNIDSILEFLDDDVSNEMTKVLKKNGVKILYESSLLKVEDNKLYINQKGKETILSPDKLLISIGRVANLKGLENLSLETYRRGVKTDLSLRTNIPNVYAIGDVNGIFNLAHVASTEGIIAVENILGGNKKISYDKVPNCVYTSPEVAAVGLNERDARAKYKDIIVSKYPLSANGKALAEGENTGFIKIIAHKEYGEILGVHLVAPTATDMISEIVTTMELEGTIYDLASSMHPHPTISEIVMEAAHGAIDKPIHL